MLTSEELFPPEYCFVGSCSSHLASASSTLPLILLAFSSPLPRSVASSLALLLAPAPSRRHCFNETGKRNLFVLPSARRKRGYPPFLLSSQYLFSAPFSRSPVLLAPVPVCARPRVLHLASLVSAISYLGRPGKKSLAAVSKLFCSCTARRGGPRGPRGQEDSKLSTVQR